MKRTRRTWRLPARRRAQVVEQPQCRAEPGECGVRSRQQQGAGVVLQRRISRSGVSPRPERAVFQPNLLVHHRDRCPDHL